LEFPPANLLRNITIDVVSTGNLAKYAKKKKLSRRVR
jgi:hypothetical protein